MSQNLVVDLTEEQAKELGVDQPKVAATSTKVEIDMTQVYTMQQAKDFCKKAPVSGLAFMITRNDNRFIKAGQSDVLGQIVAELSGRGKVQAVLTCANPGCNETHIREISDFHQSAYCLLHASTKGKLTPAEKAARLQARAQALLDQAAATAN